MGLISLSPPPLRPFSHHIYRITGLLIRHQYFPTPFVLFFLVASLFVYLYSIPSFICVARCSLFPSLTPSASFVLFFLSFYISVTLQKCTAELLFALPQSPLEPDGNGQKGINAVVECK